MELNKPTFFSLTSNVPCKSISNGSLCPGWTEDENNSLMLALEYYGIGNWKKILRSRVLPGKTVTQLYLQSQRLLKVQSLASFNKLRVNVKTVQREHQKLINDKKCSVKHGLIYNAGSAKTKKQIADKKKENDKNYGIKKAKAKFFNVDEMFKVKVQARKDFQRIGKKYFEQIYKTDEEIENEENEDIIDEMGESNYKRAIYTQEKKIENNIDVLVRMLLKKQKVKINRGVFTTAVLQCNTKEYQKTYIDKSGKKRKRTNEVYINEVEKKTNFVQRNIPTRKRVKSNLAQLY